MMCMRRQKKRVALARCGALPFTLGCQSITFALTNLAALTGTLPHIITLLGLPAQLLSA